MDPWTLNDEKLLRECRFEAFVGSGRGGQKRHKTNAAVRITHLGTGISAMAAESRSQRENRIHALRRLRHKLAMESPRKDIDLLDFRVPGWMEEYVNLGLRISEKNPRYPEAIVIVLDVLKSAHWEVSRAAVSLGVSTSALVRFLANDGAIWARVNKVRGELGMTSLVRR